MEPAAVFRAFDLPSIIILTPIPATNYRLYWKITDTGTASGGHRIFAMDYIGGGAIGGTTPKGYNPYTFPHYPSKGWGALFTDGSVKLCKSIVAYNIVTAPGYDADGCFSGHIRAHSSSAGKLAVENSRYDFWLIIRLSR